MTHGVNYGGHEDDRIYIQCGSHWFILFLPRYWWSCFLFFGEAQTWTPMKGYVGNAYIQKVEPREPVKKTLKQAKPRPTLWTQTTHWLTILIRRQRPWTSEHQKTLKRWFPIETGKYRRVILRQELKDQTFQEDLCGGNPVYHIVCRENLLPVNIKLLSCRRL